MIYLILIVLSLAVLKLYKENRWLEGSRQSMVGDQQTTNQKIYSLQEYLNIELYRDKGNFIQIRAKK